MLKIRRANPSQELLESLSEVERKFHLEYAELIVKFLQNPDLMEFIESMISKKEGIDLSQVKDIRVMVPPPLDDVTKISRTAKHGYFNHYNNSITIFPSLPYEIGISKISDKEKAFADLMKENEVMTKYVIPYAIKTLIHEILHVKYRHEEMKVLELTEHYYLEFVGMLKSKKMMG